MTKKSQFTQPFDRVLSMDEVASIFGKSKKSLWRWWAKEKIMPQPLKVRGRAIGFRESVINEFLEQLSKAKNDE